MTTALVTGANRGIGLEFCRQLRARGDSVIAVCRNASKELEALDVQTIDNIDVTDVASMATLANDLMGSQIDILICNAGIMLNESIGDMDFDSVREQFEVNALGTLHTVTAHGFLRGDIAMMIGHVGLHVSGMQNGHADIAVFQIVTEADAGHVQCAL